MIHSKKELDFYIKADHMMRTGTFTNTLKQKLIDLVILDYTFKYMKVSRKCSYYTNRGVCQPPCRAVKIKA